MNTFKLGMNLYVGNGIRSFSITSDLPSTGDVWIGFVNDEPWIEIYCNEVSKYNTSYFDVVKIYKEGIDYIPEYTVFKKIN